MNLLLENEYLRLGLDSQGAEMQSLIWRATGRQYLWQAEEAVWARHAPILFPIVGKLKNNQYHVNGQTYHLPQHGFARDRNFEVLKSSDTEALFELAWDEVSLANYPWKFRLRVQYQLVENRVEVTYTLHNEDEHILFFSLGAHPGFAILDGEGEEFSDYEIAFEQAEQAPRLELDGGLVRGRSAQPFLNQTDRLSLDAHLFDQDALIFEGLQSRWVELRHRSGQKSVRLSLEGFPWLGIWAKPGASFVCLEPWQGLADPVDGSPDFTNKTGVQGLLPSAEHTCAYTLTLS